MYTTELKVQAQEQQGTGISLIMLVLWCLVMYIAQLLITSQCNAIKAVEFNTLHKYFIRTIRRRRSHLLVALE